MEATMRDMNVETQTVLGMHRRYNGGRVSEPDMRDGVAFYSVGHNSTHGFSVGVKDGRRYVMASYYDYDAETERTIEEISVREVAEWSDAYLGHF
jgi:hypothetical protein